MLISLPRRKPRIFPHVSPLPDPAAWRIDTLSFPWMDLWAYMFPPFLLIPKVIQRIQVSNCEVILVAPAWPSQPWFSRLLSLLNDHPRCLPSVRMLLHQAQSWIFHPDPLRLSLHAWRLIKSALVSQGYSSLVATHTAMSHQLSTQSVYDSKWRIFTEWCRDAGHDPFATFAPVLADFLTFLFSAKGFAPTTIDSYRTTIINTLEKVTDHHLADEHLLASLLNQFESKFPRPGRSTPGWNLALILRSLHYAPFEPQAKAHLWALTFQDRLPDSSRLGQVLVRASSLLLPSSTPQRLVQCHSSSGSFLHG